ncbi:MAG: hypothetical protein AAGH41_09445 [Pseudomonadota bacterium]
MPALIFLTASVSACTQGATIEITNDTSCTFNDVTGYKIHPRTGDRELVFGLPHIASGETRPAYFEVNWEGRLEVVSERRPFYADEVEVTPGVDQFALSMSGGASASCHDGQ